MLPTALALPTHSSCCSAGYIILHVFDFSSCGWKQQFENGFLTFYDSCRRHLLTIRRSSRRCMHTTPTTRLLIVRGSQTAYPAGPPSKHASTAASCVTSCSIACQYHSTCCKACDGITTVNINTRKSITTRRGQEICDCGRFYRKKKTKQTVF